MDRTQKQLLALLTTAIHDRAPDRELFSVVAGNDLLDLAIQQDVSSFLYPVITKYAEEIKLDPGVRQRWKTTTLFLAARQAGLTSEIKTVLDLLAANDITVLSLKGLVLKQLYPQPELRNMGDVDLLVQEKDMYRAIELLGTIGYTANPEHLKKIHRYKHIGMNKFGALTLELHRTLWHPFYMKKRDNHLWFRHIWENKRTLELEGIRLTALSLEDELIHMVVHLATHFISSGVMLRQLCDLVLFREAYQSILDQEYLTRVFQAMGLWSFFEHLLLTCQLYLGLTLPAGNQEAEKISQLLISDIFNYELNTETADDQECWKVLSRHYPFARKSHYLISLSFILEVGVQFILNRKGLGQSIAVAKKSFAAFRTRLQFLQSIGLLAR